MEDGYEFFAKRQLVTLFSAPNYCGEFDNAGGMMSVDETLMCSFQVMFERVTKILSITHCYFIGFVVKMNVVITRANLPHLLRRF